MSEREQSGEPLRLVRPGWAAGSRQGADALRAEQFQSRVRARLFELDAELASAFEWSGYDAETGRADAVVSAATPSAEHAGLDIWLLTGPGLAWVLTVAYPDDPGTFRELERRRCETPEAAAEALLDACRSCLGPER